MAFEAIRTERLIIRRPEPGDAEAAFERRSLPEVARYQDWEMPYTRERAEASIQRSIQRADEWPRGSKGWNPTVVDAENPDRILGDLAVELRWDGRVGYFGYTFHPDHWGRGYATEASWALVTHLFDEVGVVRIESSLDPRNLPSARVLEACGLLFEGHTVQSFWVGEECSDDMLYGATRADWERWRDRPRHRPEHVALVPLAPENAERVAALVSHRSQEHYAPPLGRLFREALVPSGGTALTLRAIEADGEIVGAVLASAAGPRHPSALMHTLLIDRLHQRRGIGSAAFDLIEDEARAAGGETVELSWIEGPGSPGRFFRGRGYAPQGAVSDGRTEASKRLR